MLFLKLQGVQTLICCKTITDVSSTTHPSALSPRIGLTMRTAPVVPLMQPIQYNAFSSGKACDALFFLVHAEVTLPFYVHHDFNRCVKLRMCHLASLM